MFVDSVFLGWLTYPLHRHQHQSEGGPSVQVGHGQKGAPNRRGTGSLKLSHHRRLSSRLWEEKKPQSQFTLGIRTVGRHFVSGRNSVRVELLCPQFPHPQRENNHPPVNMSKFVLLFVAIFVLVGVRESEIQNSFCFSAAAIVQLTVNSKFLC